MIISRNRQCRSCTHIAFADIGKLTATNVSCAHCGKTGFASHWPSLFAEKWLQTVVSYRSSRSETYENIDVQDRFVLCMLLCAAAELMLTDLACSVLRKQGKSDAEIVAILNKKGRDAIVTLINKATGTNFQAACTTIGTADWYNAWIELVRARNAFAHGIPPLEGLLFDPTAAQLARVEAGMLPAFRGLHNFLLLGALPSS